MKLKRSTPAPSAPAHALTPPPFQDTGQPLAQTLHDWRFNLALALSVILHGIVLSMNFAFPKPEPRTLSHQASLEVVLVNARHQTAPKDAELLAQANLDGGGTSEAPARPTTPLPPQPEERDGNDLIEARKREEPPPQPRREREVLTKPTPSPKAVAAKPAPAPVQEEAPAPSPTPPRLSGHDLLDSVAATARLEAEIDTKLNEYAQRPRRIGVFGSRAKEFRYARYVEDWRQKVERIGTLNYPEAARGRVYGNLVLHVGIRSDGTLETVKVRRSSGHQVLDDAAVRIVRMSAPFAPFPPDIRKDGDIIDLVRTWTFTNDNRLRTQ